MPPLSENLLITFLFFLVGEMKGRLEGIDGTIEEGGFGHFKNGDYTHVFKGNALGNVAMQHWKKNMLGN